MRNFLFRLNLVPMIFILGWIATEDYLEISWKANIGSIIGGIVVSVVFLFCGYGLMLMFSSNRYAKTRHNLLFLTMLQKQEWYAFDLIQTTGYASGTIFAFLAGLEREGKVLSHWDEPVPGNMPGEKFRKRRYELTINAREEFMVELGISIQPNVP